MSTPTPQLPPLNLFINGEWVDAQSGATLSTVNPATGQPIAQVSSADAQDVDLAVRSARAALESGPWAKAPPMARSACSHIADMIEARGEELAALESLDNGKPVSAARMA